MGRARLGEREDDVSTDLPGDPGLPPGVTDDMTEARSLTPVKRNDCAHCDGNGELCPSPRCAYVCPRCNGTGVEE